MTVFYSIKNLGEDFLYLGVVSEVSLSIDSIPKVTVGAEFQNHELITSLAECFIQSDDAVAATDPLVKLEFHALACEAALIESCTQNLDRTLLGCPDTATVDKSPIDCSIWSLAQEGNKFDTIITDTLADEMIGDTIHR